MKEESSQNGSHHRGRLEGGCQNANTKWRNNDDIEKGAVYYARRISQLSPVRNVPPSWDEVPPRSSRTTCVGVGFASVGVPTAGFATSINASNHVAAIRPALTAPSFLKGRFDSGCFNHSAL